jgi:hypothetical protein
MPVDLVSYVLIERFDVLALIYTQHGLLRPVARLPDHIGDAVLGQLLAHAAVGKAYNSHVERTERGLQQLHDTQPYLPLLVLFVLPFEQDAARVVYIIERAKMSIGWFQNPPNGPRQVASAAG